MGNTKQYKPDGGTSQVWPQRLVVLLRHLLMRFRHTHRRQIAQLGMHQGQSAVLVTLWRGEGLTQTELAEKLEISPSTMTAGLQRLEQGGFIRREQDAHDQRISRVYVTEKGKAMRSHLEEGLDALEEQLLRGFDEKEIEQLREYMQRMAQNLEGCPCLEGKECGRHGSH